MVQQYSGDPNHGTSRLDTYVYICYYYEESRSQTFSTLATSSLICSLVCRPSFHRCAKLRRVCLVPRSRPRFVQTKKRTNLISVSRRQLLNNWPMTTQVCLFTRRSALSRLSAHQIYLAYSYIPSSLFRRGRDRASIVARRFRWPVRFGKNTYYPRL